VGACSKAESLHIKPWTANIFNTAAMSTVTQIVTSVVSASSAASASSTLRARPQGGILEGEDPSVYDSKNPIILFIIQVNNSSPAAMISTSALTCLSPL